MKKHQSRDAVLNFIADVLEGTVKALIFVATPKPKRRRTPRSYVSHYVPQSSHVYIHVDK